MKLKQLSIATFNLYNLNEPGVALYADRDGWSQAEYELKIAWTARQLKILKSDVFGFQELWHESSLTRALDAAGLREEYDTLVPPEQQRVMAASVGADVVEIAAGHGIFREQPARLAELLVAALPLTQVVSCRRWTSSRCFSGSS